MQHRGVLTPQAQLLYVIQWLGEFSDIEKDDFLQELLDLYAPGQLPVGRVLERVKLEGRPLTLFQCRMDLLKEWYASWTPERDELLLRINEADSEFFERFEQSRLLPNEEKIVEEFWLRNGNCNGKVNGCETQNGHSTHENRSSFVEAVPLDQQIHANSNGNQMANGVNGGDGDTLQSVIGNSSNSSSEISRDTNGGVEVEIPQVNGNSDEVNVDESSSPSNLVQLPEESKEEQKQNGFAEARLATEAEVTQGQSLAVCSNGETSGTTEEEDLNNSEDHSFAAASASDTTPELLARLKVEDEE